MRFIQSGDWFGFFFPVFTVLNMYYQYFAAVPVTTGWVCAAVSDVLKCIENLELNKLKFSYVPIAKEIYWLFSRNAK